MACYAVLEGLTFAVSALTVGDSMVPKTCVTVGFATAVALAVAVGQPAAADEAPANVGAVAAANAVVQPKAAPATAAQMRTVVPTAAETAGVSSRLVMWWQEGTVWHVALSTRSAAATTALQAALGANTVVTTHSEIVTAQKDTKLATNTRVVHIEKRKRSQAARPTGVTASASMIHPAIANPPPYPQGGTWIYSNRLLDGNPLSGGDRIFRTYTRYDGEPYESECTAAVLTNLGMLTAGHCDGGTPGTVWQQGYLASNNTLYSTQSYGTTLKSVFTANRTDAAVIKPIGKLGAATSTFNKTIYLSTNLSGPSAFATDHGSLPPNVGSRICTDGSYSDLKCGGTVIRKNICMIEHGEAYNGKPKDIKLCGIDEATSSTPIVQLGDSGGAVLSGLNSIGTAATTVGIISAKGAGNPSKDLFFSDITPVNATLLTKVVSS